MRSEKTKPNELRVPSGVASTNLRKKSGAGRYTALMRTPECATEQTEHSWPGSPELSLWTWTAWMTPVNMTSRMHNKDRAAIEVSLRDLYPCQITQKALG